MAIFAPLMIGRNALLAHQRALQVNGHNIANVNTPGFSRQRGVIAAIRPAGDIIGGGSWVTAVDQAIDPFLEARRLASASSLGAATTSRELLDRLQGLFPVQGEGIGGALQQFFAAANTLATHPQDIAARRDLLARAEGLAGTLRAAASGLAALQREADGRIAQQVSEANGLLATIAQLNRQIVAAEIGGASANDLRDARRQALGELAGVLEIHTVEQSNGEMSVFTAAGAALVLGPDAATIAARPVLAPGLDGLPLSAVGLLDGAGGLIRLDSGLGGTLGALLALRDQTLPTDAGELDLLANTLRDAVNAVQTDPAGRDLDGSVGTALFAGSGAADLVVALSDPRGIAAARSANPGDNAGALALVAVGSTSFAALGGATLSEHFGGFHARIGNQARGAQDQAAIAEEVSLALAAQRDAISGVSLEEEFTDLIRFQRGFQAASQLIAVSNRLLDDLLGLVR